MSQRISGFERMPVDLYQTPAWVLHALTEEAIDVHGKTIWEPAAGEGKMAAALVEAGAKYIHQTDIMYHGNAEINHLFDFTCDARGYSHDGLITNPPFGPLGKTAEKFIERGLQRMGEGFLALLLPSDFDAASTRARFFADEPFFAGRVTLTKRIEWFPDYRSPCKTCDSSGLIRSTQFLGLDVSCPKCRGKGSNKVGPSSNHAWFIWKHEKVHARLIPRIWYAPRRPNGRSPDATK